MLYSCRTKDQIKRIRLEKNSVADEGEKSFAEEITEHETQSGWEYPIESGISGDGTFDGKPDGIPNQ